jgi:hypothetical protein
MFRKSVEKIEISLKSDKNNGYFHEDLGTFMTIFSSFFLRMRSVSDKGCRDDQNTRFRFTNFFCVENGALYEIVENYDTAGQATDGWQYGAVALRAGYIRLQTHIQNI